MICTYRAEYAAELSQIHNALSDEDLTAVAFHQDIRRYQRVLVGMVGEEVVGYTAVSPIPGLPHIRNLQGFIAPQWQRQGLGSQLLYHLLVDLRAAGKNRGVQLSCCVADRDSAVYHFLRHHNFYMEHEELHLLHRVAVPLPPQLPPHLSLTTVSHSQAVRQFIALYDESFVPHPWYQPYTPAEVDRLLYQPQDLLFLYHGEVPIGFAWLKLLLPSEGEIEPIGVLGPWQGRGYGRLLLQAAMYHLAQQGAQQIRIGTWSTNHAALHLYRDLGFALDQELVYLACDV